MPTSLATRGKITLESFRRIWGGGVTEGGFTRRRRVGPLGSGGHGGWNPEAKGVSCGMENKREVPPGAPGVPPRWTSSRKSGVGTAIGGDSPLWFTIAHGILNELYFPTMDHANTRDAEFLVAADDGFFSEEKRHTTHEVKPVEQGVPAFQVVNSCERGRYRIHKTIFSDPQRPALLMRVRFEPRAGALADYRLYALVAPHLGNHGAGNDGWAGEHKGVPMLFAQRREVTLAVATSANWKARSCGYVGGSDGWQQVSAHGRLTAEYAEARRGNIALTGEVDLAACDGEFVLVLAFGDSPAGAGHHARAALFSDFDAALANYVRGWRDFQGSCAPLTAPRKDAFDAYRTSTAVLRTHESKRYPGAMIASLAIPWGERRGDDDLGGYHLVWPRDQCQAAMGLLAAGQARSARQTLLHLMCTQEADGSWPQNMWVDGRGYWTRHQSDQTAGCLLLVDALRRAGELAGLEPWPAVVRAADRLLANGPVTEQDRWEENSGYTPYTLGKMISGLLAAAEMAEHRSEPDRAAAWRQTADAWNASIERWLYVSDTPLAREVGVEGYYVRIAPPETKGPENLRTSAVQIKNRGDQPSSFAAAEIVSPDALALVRFGLRAADDPRIVNTVAVIDATLRHETKAGPAWRRYTHDGYGESDDGAAITGVGRCWPLLTGERAHYELARGDRAAAERLCETFVRQSHQGGLFPEQIWDGGDVPERGLFNGQPTGSAMPLVWAHAEFVTLLRSLRDGQVFDCPPQAARRYLGASGGDR